MSDTAGYEVENDVPARQCFREECSRPLEHSEVLTFEHWNVLTVEIPEVQTFELSEVLTFGLNKNLFENK